MLLIGNGRLVTRDQGLYLENGAVAIEDRLIKEVGTTQELRAKYPHALINSKNNSVNCSIIAPYHLFYLPN